MKKSIALMLLVAGMAVAGCAEKKKPVTPPATTPAPSATTPMDKPAEKPMEK